MTLQACDADGLTFAVLSSLLDDPAQMGPALQALQESLRAHQVPAAAQAQQAQDANATAPGGALNAPLAASVPGMTPHALAVRSGLQMRRPDGQAGRMESVVFTQGTGIFQATVLGPVTHKGLSAAADTFFAALHFAP